MLEAETSPPKHTGRFSLTKPGKYLNNFNDLKKYSYSWQKNHLTQSYKTKFYSGLMVFLKITASFSTKGLGIIVSGLGFTLKASFSSKS